MARGWALPVRAFALFVLCVADLVQGEQQRAANDPVSLDGHETNARMPSERVDLGEGQSPEPVQGVYVKAALFVGRTSENRFRGDMKTAFRAAIAALCQVRVEEVGISSVTAKSYVGKVAPSGIPNRRLLQQELTEDEGVVVDLSIGVKDRMAGKAVKSALKQATIGGDSSKLATKFSEECSKYDTIDARFEPHVAMFTDPYVLGGAPTPDGTSTHGLPTWCKHYGKGKDDDLFVKWTSKQCDPTWGTYEQIMDNLEGVVCICRGLKISALAPDPASPDTQTVSIVRVLATNTSYRTYSMRIRSGISSVRPTPELGVSVSIEFGQQGVQSDTSHHQVHFAWNRIFEYAAPAKTSLQESLTKRFNYQSKSIQPGSQCDNGKASPAEDGSNCVIQDFFLDKLHPAVIKTQGSQHIVEISSDLQGSEPWCRRENGGTGCPKPPDVKPTIKFTFTFDSDDFKNNRFDVDVYSFPYKLNNSTLSLRGKVYSDTLMSSLTDDMRMLSAVGDALDCNILPLPHGCPFVRANGGAQLSWGTRIMDTKTGSTHKVAVTEPKEISRSTSTILPVNLNASNATANSIFFSFEHGEALGMRWSPAISMRNLPEIAYNDSWQVAPGFLLLGVLQLCVHLLNYR